MKFFSEEKVNKGRQPELDWLKAVCILMMIMLHVYDDCANEPGGLIYSFFDYACTFLGAGAFMICMGVGMRYSRKQEPKDYVLRGIEILTVGQFLNLLRNALPNLIAWWATGKNLFIAQSLLVFQADILTFAGLAFMLIALLKSLKASDGCILAIGIAMNIAAIPIRNYVKMPENYLAGQFAGFFVMTDQASFFPLMSYFVFVAFGYYIGNQYPRMADKRALSGRVLLVCVPIVVIYYALRMTVPFPLLPEFNSREQYTLNPATDAAASCMVSLIMLSLFSRLSTRMGGKVPGFISHVSMNINRYYCVSNVLTFQMLTLLLALTGQRMPGMLWPTLYGLFIVAACYWIIEINEKYIHFTLTKLKPPKRTIVFTAIWIAAVLAFVYAYPRVTEFATIPNGFLLP